MLTGLIFCGEYASAMQGNRRNPKDKLRYVSYRCGSRMQKRVCDNKEIIKEYIKEFVLSELEKNILNDKAIPMLVGKISNNIQEQAVSDKEYVEMMLKELEDIEKQINNIVSAIMQGFAHEEFKTKMDDLKDKKAKLEVAIKEQESRSQALK